MIPLFRSYEKAELWIAGKGSYETKLKELAKSSSNIRFLGYRQGQDLETLYQKSIAVLMPSLCYEISSMVIPEAFRHHTPVVTRRLGGQPEIIEKSHAGILFETEDELRKAIDSLVDNPSYRRELGECGYKAYLENWSTKVHLKRYFELIESVASDKQINICLDQAGS